MRRRCAAGAEVVRRSHKTLAEIMLPHPIDDHARRQGMIRTSEPARQCESIMPVRRGFRTACCREDFREAWIDPFAFAFDIAATEDMTGSELSLSESPGMGRRGRHLCLKRVHLTP